MGEIVNSFSGLAIIHDPLLDGLEVAIADGRSLRLGKHVIDRIKLAKEGDALHDAVAGVKVLDQWGPFGQPRMSIGDFLSATGL